MLGQYGKNKTAHTIHTKINFTWTVDLNIDLQVYTKTKIQNQNQLVEEIIECLLAFWVANISYTGTEECCP